MSMILKEEKEEGPEVPWTKLIFSPPVLVSVVVMAIVSLVAVTQAVASIIFLFIASSIVVLWVLAKQISKETGKPA